jgi:hypothetical protein
LSKSWPVLSSNVKTIPGLAAVVKGMEPVA